MKSGLEKMQMSEGFRRLNNAILAYTFLILFGSIGYMLIMDSGFFDALYMTVISITTVGYGEVIDLSKSPEARGFTLMLLICGMVITLYLASSLTAFFVQGELRNLLWRRRMQKLIENMDKHIIVVGFNQTSLRIIEELITTKRDFVIITELSEEYEKLNETYQDCEVIAVIGNPTEDEVLLRAGINKAVGLMSALTDDKENLFVTISARCLNPNIRIIGRVERAETGRKMVKAGANQVISPESIGGLRMVSEMIRPHVVGFLDQMLRDRASQMRIEEVVCRRNNSSEQFLSDFKVEKFGNLLILALKKANEDSYIYNPNQKTEVNEGDALILMGRADEIANFRIQEEGG